MCDLLACSHKKIRFHLMYPLHCARDVAARNCIVMQNLSVKITGVSPGNTYTICMLL